MYPENFYPNQQYIPKSESMMNARPPPKSIYINKNIVHPATTKVLVNPNFTRQVHVNPNFANRNNYVPTVFINPKVLNKGAILQAPARTQVLQQNIYMESTSNVNNLSQSVITTPLTNFSKNNKPTIDACQPPTDTVIKTKTKIVRVPSVSSVNKPAILGNCQNAESLKAKSNDSTTSKSSAVNRSFNGRCIISRHKFIKIRTPIKAAVKSKYKLVRSANTSINLGKPLGSSTPFGKSKFKWVRPQNTIIKSPYKLTKKAIMMQLDPQNTIIKNTKFKLIRKIKSPKKAIKSRKSEVKILCTLPKNKFKRNLVKINKRKLKKNNIPCEMYNKKGKCKGLATGKCTKKHDPNQIQICIWFLQGICRDDKCALSHKVSPEKMPTCKFYLEGMCTKDDCPYLHVKLSKDAPVCVDFLHGYCAKGQECNKRHQFLCPDFERDGKCGKKVCRYPHGKAVRQYRDTLLKLVARNRKSNALRMRRVQEARAKKREVAKVETKEESVDTKRYYECDEAKVPEPIEEATSSTEPINSVLNRPKLGALPSFISF